MDNLPQSLVETFGLVKVSLASVPIIMLKRSSTQFLMQYNHNTEALLNLLILQLGWRGKKIAHLRFEFLLR